MTNQKYLKFALTLVFCFFCLLALNAQSPVNWKNVRVLVYKKNGKGYVHENIPFAAKAIIDLGAKHGFHVDTSSQPLVMTEKNLSQYTMLIFTSTNNDVFDTNEQRLAFRRYIEAGGGFVGIHSVTGTERNWPWFMMMLGGTFSWHANFQTFTVRVIDSKHPSVKGVPLVWNKADECYFAKELYPGFTPVMVNDFSTIDTSNVKQKELLKKHAGNFAKFFPSAWYYNYDGGVTWCTTLGHDKSDYTDPVYLTHIMGGITYVAETVKKIDFSKAYATSFNEDLHY